MNPAVEMILSACLVEPVHNAMISSSVTALMAMRKGATGAGRET